MPRIVKIGDSLQRRTVNHRRKLLKQHIANWALEILDLCAVRLQPEEFFDGFGTAVSELKRRHDDWGEML